MISADSGGTFTTYTYDYRNRLTEVTQGGTVIATYTYNALDQRIGVQEGGSRTWTVYNGTSADATPYADFNGSGTLLTRYLYGPGVINGAVVDEILARTSSGGTTAWYLPDNLGSVRDIVSSSGSLLDHIVYDSFGNILTETNASNGDRFKFAGMQYDSTTHQYFDQARWYGSGSGRFLSVDPTGFTAADTDLYRYAANSPENLTDPTGLSYWSDYWYYLNNPNKLDPGFREVQIGAMTAAVVSTAIVSGGITAGAAGMQFVAFGAAWGGAVLGTAAYLNGGSLYDATMAGAQRGALIANDILFWAALGEAAVRAIVNRTSTTFAQLSCFPAGTLVATADGLRPIESIVAGERVWAYDLIASEWKLRHVLRTYSRPCGGSAAAVTVAGETIDSTSRHPYFVVRGENLEDRPRLEHLAEVPAGATTPGRWVDAMDLMVGDALLLRDGRIEPIQHLRTYPFFDTVYNFDVDDLHCYAIGRSSVLVHNSNGPDGPPAGVAPDTVRQFQGTEKPWTTGATPNSTYTHIDPKTGRAIQNAVYDQNGNVIGHVDFTNHGPGALSGHGHQFPQPGNPGSGHGPGKPHIPYDQLPPGWGILPPGVSPRKPIGE